MLLPKVPKKSMASQNRHYCTVQKHENTSDGEGGFTKQWIDVVGYTDVPMAIIPLNAKRKEEYRTFNVDASHMIRVRGEITLDESNYRIKYGNRIFEIKEILDIQERGIEQEVYCLERRD